MVSPALVHLVPINHAASDTTNDSSVSGTTVKDALNTLSSSGGYTVVTVSSSPYVMLAGKYILLVDTTSARQLNLPAPATTNSYIIKDKTGTANTNNITLHRNASEKIEGLTADRVLSADWGAYKLESDATDWYLTA